GVKIQPPLTQEPFDPGTREPVRWTPSPLSIQVHQWARRWLAERWDEWQPRTRASAIEVLVRFVPLVAGGESEQPPDGYRDTQQMGLPAQPGWSVRLPCRCRRVARDERDAVVRRMFGCHAPNRAVDHQSTLRHAQLQTAWTGPA